MKTINISVRDKLPTVTAMSGSAVADNKYRLMFAFDDEWEPGLKTIIVAGNHGKYTPYPTDNDMVDIELDGTRVVHIGVVQDVVATSRPCQIIVNESIRQRMGEEVPAPEPDVWEYITEQVRKLGAAALYPVDKTAGMTQPVGRDADGHLWTAPGSGGSGGESYEIGYGLILDGRKLSTEIGRDSFVEIPNTKVQEIFNRAMEG